MIARFAHPDLRPKMERIWHEYCLNMILVLNMAMLVLVEWKEILDSFQGSKRQRFVYFTLGCGREHTRTSYTRREKIEGIENLIPIVKMECLGGLLKNIPFYSRKLKRKLCLVFIFTVKISLSALTKLKCQLFINFDLIC